MHHLICQYCRLEFDAGYTTAKFCRKGCYAKSKTGVSKPFPQKKPAEKRQCCVCDQEFEVGGHNNQPRTARYCSIQCRVNSSIAFEC